jgi:hypothetical protein
MTITRLVLVTVAVMWVLTSFSTTVRAQAVPVSMLVNPSVRSIGMGETGGADPSDPTNSYLNPAVLPNGASVYLSGLYEQLLGSDRRLKGLYAGGSYEFGLGSGIGLGIAGQVRYILPDYGERVGTNAFGQTTGINPTDSYVGLTLASDVRFSDAVSIALGVSLKDWKIDPDVSGAEAPSGTAYDAGLRLAFTATSEGGWETEVALAASVSNLNGEYQVRTFELDFDHDANYAFSIRSNGPLRKLGTGAYVPRVGFVFNVDALVPERERDDLLVRLGGEFSVMRIVFLRLGWMIPEDSSISILVFGCGLGVPSKYFDVRLDFAVFPLEILGSGADVNDRDQRASLSLNVPLPFGSSGVAPEN